MIKKSKRIWRMRAQNGDSISIWLHPKPPKKVKSQRDIMEIRIDNDDPISYFIRPDEALHIASGLFLALIEYLPEFLAKEDT